MLQIFPDSQQLVEYSFITVTGWSKVDQESDSLTADSADILQIEPP